MSNAHIFTFFIVAAFTYVSLAISIVNTSSLCGPNDNSTECSALIDFAYSTQYKNWNYSTNWLSGTTFCNWFGIQCDLNNNIIKLNLSENNLNGSIVDSFSNLSYLKSIDIHGGRDIGGEQTQSMCIYRNNFNNSILPSSILNNLINLNYFDVGCTLLGGTIPTTINKITNLTLFRVYGCLFNGTIPNEITELSKLEVLKLVRNPISGTLPSWRKYNPYLKKLGLNFMALTGTIPDTFDMIPNVEHVVLDGNGLYGSIPNSIGRLKNLKELAFNINNLTGIIDKSFCDAFNDPNVTNGDHCHIGSDTKESGYPYYAPYPWLLNVVGNQYKCPLPKCCVGNGFCNQTNTSYINPCIN